MNLRFIDWIWHVRGALPLAPRQSAAEAFGQLEVLFHEQNTTYAVKGDTLSFTKKNQLPQDKMAVFDSGSLRIADGKLRYEMTSRALLACFIAPLFFFAIGHIGIALDHWRNPPEVVAAKEKAEKKRATVKAEDVPMNPIDKFLGAPMPEKKKSKDGNKKDTDKIGKRNRTPSMTTAYVFMGIFFALWIFGRILEHVLIHTRLRKKLMVENASHDEMAGQVT